MADNVAAAYRYLRSKGLSSVAAAGAVGGLTGESGPKLDPSARNPTSGAIGIGQWLGGRARGVKPGDFQGQLKHLWGELTGSERGALSALKGAKTPEQAAEIWTRTFERPSAGEIAASLPSRQAAARRILAQHGGDAATAPGPDSSVAASRAVPGHVTPSVDKPDRAAAVEAVLRRGASGGLPDFRSAGGLAQADSLFKSGLATRPTDVKVTEAKPGQPTKSSSTDPAGARGSNGQFTITGPNPGRLKPELVSFAKKVAGVYGGPLTGSDGTGHSRLTTSGNVSEHTTGNATDIPATGSKLLKMGQSALIAAGMPEAEARKAKGGLYNVGNHQIIFLSNIGGNHFNHLHISTHAKGR